MGGEDLGVSRVFVEAKLSWGWALGHWVCPAGPTLPLEVDLEVPLCLPAGLPLWMWGRAPLLLSRVDSGGWQLSALLPKASCFPTVLWKRRKWLILSVLAGLNLRSGTEMLIA